MITEEKACRNCGRVFQSSTDFLEGTYQWRLCSLKNLWFNCSCGSTLMLPKGKFSWYAPTLNMSPESATLFTSLSTNNKIPHLPTALMEIHSVITLPDSDAQQIANAIRKDPLLAGELLGLADTLRAVRSPDEKSFTNLSHAIVYVGREELLNLSTIAALKSFQLETRSFSSKKFWSHAFLTGKIAETLAKELNLSAEDQDRAFISGCLCNIGKIVGAVLFPAETDHIWDLTHNIATQTYWEEAESKVTIPQHMILGEIGAVFWGFPHFVLDVARHHHSAPVEYARLRTNKLISVSSLSNYFAYWLAYEPHKINELSMFAVGSRLGYEPEDLEELVSKIKPQLREQG